MSCSPVSNVRSFCTDAARARMAVLSPNELSPNELALEKFRPSIDWGNQIVVSVWWILEAWAISAVCVLVIGILLIRYTTWAKRFWSVTGDYFMGRDSLPVWATLAVLLLSVILEVRIAVLLSYYNNDLFSALQIAFQGVGAHNAAQRNSGVHGFWVAIAIFCLLAVIHIHGPDLDARREGIL